MKGRLVIPIHNRAGDLVAYAGCSIDNSEPKYRFPRGFLKSPELFNLHWALTMGSRDVVVVEGYFDCVNVHQAGIPHVVAMKGKYEVCLRQPPSGGVVVGRCGNMRRYEPQATRPGARL